MAFDSVQAVLAAFPWLSQLGDEITNILIDGVLAGEPPSVILQTVRDSNTYKSRFKGLVTRQAAGLPAITEAEYLEDELGYLNQLRNFQILGTLGLDSTESFRAFAAELIGKDVSVAEFNARLDKGVAQMRDVAPEIRSAFEQWYGVAPTDDALLVYFLDPDRGLDIIEDQVATATIGGQAFRHGLNITKTRAEILRREGVTADLARQGFADIAREEPMLGRLAEIHSFTPLSQEDLEELFFHEDPEIASRRNRIFSQALAAFQGGGARNRSRLGGLGELVEQNRAI